MNRNDNKTPVLEALKLLEKNGHIKEIRWLSESFFCEQMFPWIAHDAIGIAQPILKFIPKYINSDVLRTDDLGYERYYKDPMCLDGLEYLVSKEWKAKSIHDFFEWIAHVLDCDYQDFMEIINNDEV